MTSAGQTIPVENILNAKDIKIISHPIIYFQNQVNSQYNQVFQTIREIAANFNSLHLVLQKRDLNKLLEFLMANNQKNNVSNVLSHLDPFDIISLLNQITLLIRKPLEESQYLCIFKWLKRILLSIDTSNDVYQTFIQSIIKDLQASIDFLLTLKMNYNLRLKILKVKSMLYSF